MADLPFNKRPNDVSVSYSLHLLSRMPESGELHTRFMFRDIEVNWYRNALERLGFAHRIARMYRRRVIVPEAD